MYRRLVAPHDGKDTQKKTQGLLSFRKNIVKLSTQEPPTVKKGDYTSSAPSQVTPLLKGA